MAKDIAEGGDGSGAINWPAFNIDDNSSNNEITWMISTDTTSGNTVSVKYSCIEFEFTRNPGNEVGRVISQIKLERTGLPTINYAISVDKQYRLKDGSLFTGTDSYTINGLNISISGSTVASDSLCMDEDYLSYFTIDIYPANSLWDLGQSGLEMGGCLWEIWKKLATEPSFPVNNASQPGIDGIQDYLGVPRSTFEGSSATETVSLSTLFSVKAAFEAIDLAWGEWTGEWDPLAFPSLYTEAPVLNLSVTMSNGTGGTPAWSAAQDYSLAADWVDSGSYPIVSLTPPYPYGSSGFVLDGGVATYKKMLSAGKIRISGSTGNDGLYSVISLSYVTSGPYPTDPYVIINVSETIPDTTPDGALSTTVSGGSYVYGTPPTWAPSTVYAKGEIVRSSGITPETFQCLVAGTSGSTEPIWNGDNPGDSTWDNTVGWVRITDLAGNRFECTVSGTSGLTEPSWDHRVGYTTTDGTVTWTRRSNLVSWSGKEWALPAESGKVKAVCPAGYWDGIYVGSGNTRVTNTAKIPTFVAYIARNSWIAPANGLTIARRYALMNGTTDTLATNRYFIYGPLWTNFIWVNSEFPHGYFEKYFMGTCSYCPRPIGIRSTLYAASPQLMEKVAVVGPPGFGDYKIPAGMRSGTYISNGLIYSFQEGINWA